MNFTSTLTNYLTLCITNYVLIFNLNNVSKLVGHTPIYVENNSPSKSIP